MNNTMLKETYKDAKAIGKEMAEHLDETSECLEKKAGDAVRDVRRNLHQLRDRTEDTIEETKHAIRKNPLAAIAFTAGICAGLGVLFGVLMGSRKRDS